MQIFKLQFNIVVAASADNKTNVTLIRRLRFADSPTWFGFPGELQLLSAHGDLLKVPVLKSAVSSLKSRGNYRNVNVTLPQEIYELYVDLDGNFVFNDHVLGEVDVVARSSMPESQSSTLDSMVSCLEKLSTPKEDSVKEILRHILLEKFHPKNRNVESWCDRFERELIRFNLVGRRQIEVLKSCLDPSLINWFIVTQENLPSDAEWLLWRQELVSNFGDSSFSPICSAIGYRYQSGSYIDYVINKEKLLLEVNRDFSRSVMLDLIVFGLPIRIVKSLNKNNITSIQLLKDKLKKYENEEKFNYNNKVKFNKPSSPTSFRRLNNNYQSNNNNNSNFGNAQNNVNSGRKNFNTNQSNFTSCTICANKGFPNRRHTDSQCFSNLENSQKNVNNLEYDNSPPSEDGNQKN